MPQDKELAELSRKDQELERRSSDLARRIWQAKQQKSDEEVEELEAELEKTVIEHFEVRQQKRRRQLELLRKELDKTAEVIEKRESRREQIIERRLNQLLGKKDELDF